jgi:two-component system NtrC family sensor kinase
MNILNNAQQAIDGIGDVTITTSQEGDMVKVTIRDTGGGIPEAIRDKICDPFFTTKEPGVGTGLGLSLSYSLLAKLGGSIDFTSEVGRGTEFRVTFPLLAAKPDETEHERQTLQVTS